MTRRASSRLRVSDLRRWGLRRLARAPSGGVAVGIVGGVGVKQEREGPMFHVKHRLRDARRAGCAGERGVCYVLAELREGTHSAGFKLGPPVGTGQR